MDSFLDCLFRFLGYHWLSEATPYYKLQTSHTSRLGLLSNSPFFNLDKDIFKISQVNLFQFKEIALQSVQGPVSQSLLNLRLNLRDFEVIILVSYTYVLNQKHYLFTKIQQSSWEVMKICPLKIAEIRYWSFFLLVTLHISYVCFV